MMNYPLYQLKKMEMMIFYVHSDDRPTGVDPSEAANDTTNIGPPNEENENAAHESNTTANNDDDMLLCRIGSDVIF